jgi:hypothetical protein
MEFLSANLVNTTTMLSVERNSGVTSLPYVIDPDTTRQWRASDSNLGTNTCIQITFDQATEFDTIIFYAPLRSFKIYRDGVTSTALSISGAATTTADYVNTSNVTNRYFFRLSQTYTATTLHFQCARVITSNGFLAVGYIYVGNQLLDFSRIPDASSYIPAIKPHQIVHEMSDGGIRTQTLSYNRSVQLKFRNISQTFRDELKSIYDLHSNFGFVAFNTGTGWDGFFLNCYWEGDFDFYKLSEDHLSIGYSGNIKLREAGV